MPTKTSKIKASEGKPNALQKPLQPSEELAAVVGTSPLPRGEVVSKIWEYIRSHNLQNPENRREILADDKLTKVFGTDKVTMFEMNKHLARHLKERARLDFYGTARVSRTGSGSRFPRPLRMHGARTELTRIGDCRGFESVSLQREFGANLNFQRSRIGMGTPEVRS